MTEWERYTLQRSNPRYLKMAILAVHSLADKPGQEDFYWRKKIRQQMIEAIQSQWFKIARDAGLKKFESDQFPFRDDYVLELWMKYRKLTEASKEDVKSRLDEFILT